MLCELCVLDSLLLLHDDKDLAFHPTARLIQKGGGCSNEAKVKKRK